jgi:hypothetical protein
MKKEVGKKNCYEKDRLLSPNFKYRLFIYTIPDEGLIFIK